MKRGFFAHCICYREQIYHKHILFLNEKDEIIEITPFSNETSNTTFIDGILIVASPSFHIHLTDFIATIKKQIENTLAGQYFFFFSQPGKKQNIVF